MLELLIKHSNWDPVEERVKPVASPLVRGSLYNEDVDSDE